MLFHEIIIFIYSYWYIGVIDIFFQRDILGCEVSIIVKNKRRGTQSESSFKLHTLNRKSRLRLTSL